MNYCPNCGNKTDTTDKFCPECGKNISAAKNSSLKKWLLLAISSSVCAVLLLLLISVLIVKKENTKTKTFIVKPAKKAEAKPVKPKQAIKTRSLIASEFDFTCQIPETWTTNIQGNMFQIYGPINTEAENASIVVQRFFHSPQKKYTLNDLGDSVVNQFISYPNYQLIEDRKGSLSRKTTVRFFHTKKDKMYTYEQVLLKDKGRIYAIAYVLPSDIYDRYHDVMKTVVTTFKFI